MPFVKQASDADVQVADRLLRQIHDENPSFWPHGLSRAHFDGGLYLLSKQAGMETVGFVGWQERQEPGRRVGYYSIGILPQHRRKEYAKRAVQAVLTEKSAGVDEVRAMVAQHNEPSKHLARSLDGVTLLEKAAAGKAGLAKMLGTALAGGTSTMLLQDNMMHPSEELGTQAFNFGDHDKSRNLMNIVNFALGAGGAATARKGFLQMGLPGQSGRGAAKVGLGLGTMITGPIVKDVAMDSHRAIEGVDRLSKDLPGAVASAKPDAFKIPDSLVNGGLALGAAGIGTAALISVLRMRERRREAEAARGGRIRVTLPTKNPGDSETTIDMPTEGFDMSAALQGKLKRDTKRRLLLETRQRTIRRKPVDPNNLTAAELEDQQLELERQQLELEHGPVPKNFLKAAYHLLGKSAGAAPAVPSPPAQGTNPALRMTQQAQSAQQLAQGASTDQNPQIMQAQQAASAAEQKAQQDVAAAQQQTQQESMQRDQAHAQELAKKDQETFQARQEMEIQKTEVEKAKVEMELAKAKMDADREIEDNKKSMTESLSKGDSSAVHRMNKQRLARIKSTLSKVATAAPTLAPAQTPTPAAPPKELLPGTAQRINDRGNEFQAHGGLVRPHLYRNSYGKLGDMAYGMLARPLLMAPGRDDSADWANLSPETMAANPDAFDSMLRAGQQVMNSPR